MTERTAYPDEREWQPIETVPRDGSTILVRQAPWSSVHATWRDGAWFYVEYAGPVRPTQWKRGRLEP